MPSLSVGRAVGWFVLNEPFMLKRNKNRGLFLRALPGKKSSRERRSRREPEKNGHFGTLTTHFLRETSTHIFMRVPAAAPQRFVRGTYLHLLTYCVQVY